MNAPTLALSFTEPRALWALLLAAPLLAAHLWRRRRLRRVVPFVPLLSEALGPARGGGGWRRLAETGALAARLLALGALTLAWAGPEPAPRAPPVPLVLVLDGDLTTGCQEPDGRSRLAHALHLGAAHVRAHAQGPVSAVWAGLTPRVLAQGRRDRSALADELVGAGGATVVSPEPGTADLRPALRLARDLGGPEARVLLLSARELPPELAPGAAEAPAGALQVVGTGSASRNQGFVALHVAPVDEGPRLRVSATVRNEHDEPVERRVRALVGEVQAQAQDVRLAAGGEAQVVFDLLPPRGGAQARLLLEGRDALEADDRVDLALPPPLRPSVLAVHDGRGLRPATAALLAALGERIDREASGAVAATALAGAAPRDVVLVDGAALPPGALSPGAWLFLAPLVGALPFEVLAPVERPLVWRVRAGHPLVRDLDLSAALAARAFPIRAEPGLDGLAFAGGEAPVLAEGARGLVRFIALGLDPDGGEMPVSAALPLLLRNAILRLAQGPIAPLPPFVRVGDVLRPLSPLPGGPGARLTWSGGVGETELTPEGAGWPVPAGSAGPLRVTTGGDAATFDGRTAVVDVDPARRVRPARPEGLAPEPRADPAPAGRDLRLVLVGLAGLLLVADLWMLRRAAGAAPA